MKALVSTMAISLLVLLTVMPLAYGQEKPPAQAQARTFEGQLTKVDATARTISLKGPGDKEMIFLYTDTTEVVGSAKNVQGLSGQTGVLLRITYQDAAGKNTATRIETVEKR